MSSLNTQTQSRKERLAQLRDLKRKRDDESEQRESIVTRRNYDAESRQPVQGFFEPPNVNVVTVEDEAKRIEYREDSDEDDKDDEEQERGENWDLKREIADDLDKLEAQTEKAINKIVRESTKA
ncbi:mRNA splicing factor [Lipomyces arxii]|uniref:mRNA splicing factor n=1 Tax=Lipomyces arxii TaxID=56418 RepID=UPI0034CFAF3E